MRLALLSVFVASAAFAHSVTADGVTTEWSARTPPFSNMGIIARTDAGTGEYIFDDAAGDVRTDFGAPSSEFDLRRFAVTADADSISFLVRVAASGNTPQFQISVDLNQTVDA